ncbi:MAG: hypothetical protein ACL93V_01475 [Candidatus Electrothrix sp. YB6]
MNLSWFEKITQQLTNPLVLVMFILSVLSTLYPILKINRYRPVEAMRHV